MKRKLLFPLLCSLVVFFVYFSASAQTVPSVLDKQYDEKIKQLWNEKKAYYTKMVSNSGETPYNLYTIQTETNNLLKYAGYCQNYLLLDELNTMFLLALNTLTLTDQYTFYYYPETKRSSVHKLSKKYKMWLEKKKGVAVESTIVSAQFIYLLSDAVAILVDIKKEMRTPIMNEALNKFIPVILEHYDRWIFGKPGPFEVRSWGCRYDGRYLPGGMNHLEFLSKKINYNLGNNQSPSYCNKVTDRDMWIIAGVANILTVYKKERDLVGISPEEYRKLLSYLKTGIKLMESRFIYTNLENFEGKKIVGVIFEPGVGDHPDRAYAGYSGKEFPEIKKDNSLKYRVKNLGWDLSHFRRFVHVFDSLLRAKDVLGLNFPQKDLLIKMANQLVYATFNRDFQKPLFANFMDGTNGWYRVNYSGQRGFAYGPSDMSQSVLTGGYGFWSIYNSDVEKVFYALIKMLESDDPDIRRHVIEHYETYFWYNYKRIPNYNLKNMHDTKTQSIMMQFMPSLYFMHR